MPQSTFQEYAQLTVDAVLKKLNSTATTGLTTEQIAQLKKTYGPNRITMKKYTWWDILLRQLRSPFVYIFILFALPSLFLHQYENALFILLCILINTTVGFYQEYKANKNVELLKKYLISFVTVMRDNQEQTIDSAQLLPGDIIILRPGNIVPADVRFMKLDHFSIDEAALTGESKPVTKITGALDQNTNIDMFSAQNIGFKGTTVISGSAQAVVIVTGDQTAFGSIVHLTTTSFQESNFAKSIARLGNFILYLILITITLTFLINVMRGTSQSIAELFLFALALAIGVIPEALPVVVTFSLSRGALLLAKQKVIIKRLSALEDLGSVEVICTDKTGTLTQNSLAVGDVWGKDKQMVLFNALLARETALKDIEHPGKGFDNAMWAQLVPEKQKDLSSYTKLAEIPFDPNRRRNVVALTKDGTYFIIIRGMFEEVIKHTSEKNDELSAWAYERGNLGNRVIAIGYKKITEQEAKNLTIESDEQGITILGAIAFDDPIKPTAKQAVIQAQKLGLIIKILSGDSKEVCGAVAKEIGLIKETDQVLLGTEFDTMSEIQKAEAVKKYTVFARVLPEQKYEIISLLQHTWQVGYLGDGINDTPALHKADVSMVVQEAIDIARETADIILLKKSLLVIVQGVTEGRKIIANIMKYVKITLACALGNLYTLSLASLIIDYPPMLPLHLILLSACSDLPMLAISTDAVALDEIKKPQKYSTKSILLYSTVFGTISTVFDFIFFGIFKRYAHGVLQTGWFIESMLAELIFAFSGRSNKLFFRASMPSLPLIFLSSILALASVIIPLTCFGQYWLQFTQLSYLQLTIIFVIVLGYFCAAEILKYFYNKLNNGFN